jgi:diaminopimelate epimerase
MPSIEKVDLNSIYQELYKTIKDLDINLSIFTKSKGDIHIRTYENGTGETLSCGSAALCVAAKSLTKNKVKVISMGGELSFKANKNGILMAGPSNFIYRGATNE